MKKLPDLKTRETTPLQRERLKRWLQEWNIDRILREEDKDDATLQIAFTDAGKSLVDHVSPVSAEQPVEPGQIRLVSPDMKAGLCRPLYIAILSVNKDKIYLVAPYSRFSEPAFPGELLTQRTTACLRVLCLWNAVDISLELAGESWLVDRLSEKEMDEAMSVYRLVTGDGSLPPDLTLRVGPQLIHPDDPRRNYRREEKETIRNLAAGIKASTQLRNNASAWPTIEDEDRELPKVAEPPDDYNPSGPPQKQ